MVGDRVLQQIAARIRSCLRPTDTLARHGGDEFTLAVGQLSRIEDVLAVLRKTRVAFERPVIAGTQEVFVTFSIGIAVFPTTAPRWKSCCATPTRPCIVPRAAAATSTASTRRT